MIGVDLWQAAGGYTVIIAHFVSP